MPLVHTGAREQPRAGEARERARKIRPQFTRGELRRVTGGRNQAEAELVQNILLEQGIPSLLRRSRGFDVPDFLSAGPRDVLVPESGYERARELLRDADLLTVETPPAPRQGMAFEVRLALGILIAAAIGFGIVWLAFRVQAG